MNRYSDNTLKRMPKDELIRYIRVLERDCDSTEEHLAQMYEDVKDWQLIIHAEWINNGGHYYHCSRCGRYVFWKSERWNSYNILHDYPYCHCGAKMSLED